MIDLVGLVEVVEVCFVVELDPKLDRRFEECCVLCVWSCEVVVVVVVVEGRRRWGDI